MSKISESVREQVLRSEVTFQSIADRLGVDLSTVSKKMSGDRQFTVSELLVVVEILNGSEAMKNAGRKRKLSIEELVRVPLAT